jgi:hypothetical protein
MMVVLLPASENEPSLEPATVSDLGRLGVTSVAVLRDDRMLGLVVEGWAFDPMRSGRAVATALVGRISDARTLYPLLEVAVSTAATRIGGQR